ncbi:VanW family protein [Umezawaea endophytica]|uniref:VanW family protein n=2 Tax=Umezawaea endophytica TaxID=1654476 RepID=A0A9X3AGZ7_9PSEU|nr:VanW family protein [Umezawaea endophytica]MCS7480767.1 VanW family protein [Umezawaea endophytica]
MPDKQRPEYEAERTMAIEPVRPRETASEKTAKFSAASLQASQDTGWPEHEPDGEAEFASSPTVRTAPPPPPPFAPPTPQAEATSFLNTPPPPVPGPPVDATSFLGVPGPTAEATSFVGAPGPTAEATSFVGAPTPPAAATSFYNSPPPPDGTTAVHGPVMVEQGEDGDPEAAAAARKKRLRKIGIVAGAAAGVLVALYGLDILISSGNVPRGVTVAGVEVGGLSHGEAEAKLRQQIEPRLSLPFKATAGDVETEIDPKAAGLTLDWSSTIDRAGSQPLSPITRVTSFFTSREVGFATSSDSTKLAAALEGMRATTDHDPVEGTIAFEGATPKAVDPKQGQKLEADKASAVVLADWAKGQVELPVTTTPVKTTKEGVEKALNEVAKPAVASPVLVKGEGKDATLTPEQLAGVLVFEPADGGALNAKIDGAKFAEAAGPQLKETEKEGKDAEVVFDSGAPVVKESVDGLSIDWEKSLVPGLDVLKRADQREIKAEYKKTPAKVTTEAANKLGIKEVIGSFETGGFAADSGTNIKVVAAKVNGAIVKPGETFSLNGFTGQRAAAQGYVEAGIINNGAPGRAVGGGISQFATTLYNASYYAGMKDAGHQAHSYWISRYPAGREATVFENPDGSSVIDLKFTNDAETGVAIQTIWTPSSLKVVLWGTKRFQIEGVTGEKTNFTEPQTIHKETTPCAAGTGAQGFTVTDTRIIKDLAGNEVRRENQTVKYDASPTIVCGPKDPKPPGS